MLSNAPIRVLILSGVLDRGGAETMTMNYYRHIDHSRVQYDFLVPQNGKCGAYEDEILSMGGHIYKIPPIHDFRYIKDLVLFFRTHSEYKIVHSNIDEFGFIPLLVAKLFGVPVRIAHAHTSRIAGSHLLIRNFFRKELPKYATHFFACGTLAGQWLFGEKVVARGEVTIVKNAIDLDHYDYSLQRRRQKRDALRLDEKQFVVGTVGRLTEVKNQVFLFKIFQQVLKAKPDSVLLMVGDGELRQELEEKCSQLGIEEHVRFLGSVPDDWVYMDAMDAFILPSLYEGLPMSLIEAQVSGLPCYVSSQVTHEAEITDLVTFIPLAASAEKWSEKIFERPEASRTGHRYEAKQAHMDITTEAATLEDFYINALSNSQRAVA